MPILEDKIKGVLFGQAIGDALGLGTKGHVYAYPIFLSPSEQFPQVHREEILGTYSTIANDESLLWGELSWLFKPLLYRLIFNSFVHIFTFYAVECVFLRSAEIIVWKQKSK